MKKIIIGALLLAFIVFPSCIAESIDLDSMDLYQLLELEQAVQKKIYEYDPSVNGVLYQGSYVVGDDIESGGYLFQCIDLTPSTVRISISNYDTNNNVIEFEYVDLGESYHLSLKENQVLKIDGGVVSYLHR